MKTVCFSILFLCLGLITVQTASAGSLTPDLEELARSDTTSGKVKVWIKMVNDGSRQPNATVQAQAATRAARHSLTLGHLRNRQAQMQTSLLERLHKLESDNKATAIHGYWIVDVVEVEIEPKELPALVARPDIERIQRVPDIYLISPAEKGSHEQAMEPDSVQSNLAHINADQAWAAGYTGTGRLVCSFDTGVEGSHDALAGGWKGQDGNSSAAWFDPVFEETSPDHQSTGDGITDNHGTHVMGIMVGRKDSSGDTTGVAPDARWISARVIDVGANVILRAFEWAADPDGNPNTVDDVPDVINHSWGYDRTRWNIFCQDIYFEAIESSEALGIVNIFAAGNGGPTAVSIANPANGNDDSLTCFAVGNLNQSTDIISSSSSRGPSNCFGPSAIKPNVVAPGNLIRSSRKDNTFGPMSGTSMASPHVSGLVALLRQKNPNATVDEIKTAILASAFWHPNFQTQPNNTYGWGEIDCMAALAVLDGPATSLNVRIYDFDFPSISPGDTVTGTIVLECLGGDVNNVSGTITGSHPSLTVLDGSSFFGNMTHGDTLRSTDTVRVIVSDTVTGGQILSVDYLISGDGLSTPTRLSFIVDPPSASSIVTHNTGRIKFSLSNFGVYGFGPGSVVPGPGVGFDFDSSGNQLYEAGLIIGTGLNQVSSAVHSYVVEANNDFRVAPGGNLQLVQSFDGTAEQTFCIFNDSNAASPTGIEITQESFADNAVNTDLIILRYILKNSNSRSLNGLYFGLYLDWDVVSFTQNVGGYEVADGLAWIAYYNSGSPKDYRGTALLKGPLATAMTERGANIAYIPADGGDGFEMFEKYLALTDGFGTADTHRNTPGELFQLTAAGPIDFAPDGIDTVAFAILAGSTLVDIRDAVSRARSVLTDVETPAGGSLPERFVLHQNYPNPFNPSTTIIFDLPRAAEYELRIYNALGQQVHEQIGRSGAGRVSVKWNAGEFASGVYLYKVEADGYAETRKMLLLK
jgi:subtilisin family serine protease